MLSVTSAATSPAGAPGARPTATTSAVTATAQRAPTASGPGGPAGQGGYGDWEQDQGDDSFLPGFGRGDEYGGRGAGRAPERDGRYDYDDRRGRPGDAR